MIPETGGGRFGAATSGSVRLLAVALGVSLAAMLARLVLEPFDHGYIRYAGLAAEMLRSGDWAVARLGGEPYFHKPPLYVWLIALPMRWTGGSAGWVQHVPDLLGWTLALGWTAAFARRRFGGIEPALVAAAVLATSAEFFALTRGKRLDPLFAAWITGAIFHLERALDPGVSRRGARGATLAAGIALGLALVTKGPLALLFVGLAAVGWACWEGRAPGRAAATIGGAFALALLPALAWVAWVVSEIGWGALLAGIQDRGLFSRHAGPFHYLVRLPVQFAPWSLWLPALVAAVVALGRSRRLAALRLPLCAVGAVLVPLELSPVKHSRYLLPAYPMLALLVTALFHGREFGAEAEADGEGAWFRAAARLREGALAFLLGVLALAGAAAPVAAWVRPEVKGGWEVAAVAALGVAVASIGAAGLRALVQGGERPPRRAFAFAVVGVLLAFAGYDAARGIEFARATRGAAVTQALAPVARGEPAAAFLLGEIERHIVLLATGCSPGVAAGADELRARLERTPAGRLWVVTTPAALESLRALGSVRIGEMRRVALTRGPLLLVRLERDR